MEKNDNIIKIHIAWIPAILIVIAILSATTLNLWTENEDIKRDRQVLHYADSMNLKQEFNKTQNFFHVRAVLNMVYLYNFKACPESSQKLILRAINTSYEGEGHKELEKLMEEINLENERLDAIKNSK